MLGQIIRVNGGRQSSRAGFATAKEQFPVAHRRLPPPVRASACRSAKRAYTCVRVPGYEWHTRVCARANDLFLAGVAQPPDALFGATHGHATILRLLFFSVESASVPHAFSLFLSFSLFSRAFLLLEASLIKRFVPVCVLDRGICNKETVSIFGLHLLEEEENLSKSAGICYYCI